ncbi:MAG: hypothetical protein AABY27_04130 [Pseudomonadota bacterium]
MYTLRNKKFSFNPEKDSKIVSERKLSFQDIINAIMNNKALAFIPHPNQEKYPNQKIIYVEIEEEIYVVPCVEDKDTLFLKTLFPSRKARQLFLPKKIK